MRPDRRSADNGPGRTADPASPSGGRRRPPSPPPRRRRRRKPPRRRKRRKKRRRNRPRCESLGDPKFSRAKYERPSHPWEAERIKTENELLKKYGLKNKKELWRSQYVLRRFRQRARELQARVRTGDKQAEKEREQLLRRLGRLGLLPLQGTTLDDVLALDVEAVLSRRPPTLTFLQGLAFTPRQARQFIVHGHVSVGGRRVTIPGILVSRTQENVIAYDERSGISNDLHPVRQQGQIPGAPASEGIEDEGPDLSGDEPAVPSPPSEPGPKEV